MADRRSCLLYYITDRTQFPGDESARRQALLGKIDEAACAGVDYVQLREKDLSARELGALAKEARAVVRNCFSLRTENREPGTGPSLLINSRTDVALAAGADGVHLRADDISPREVHQILQAAASAPPITSFLVGVSCHSIEEVKRAEAEAADFAVFAPVFGKAGSAETPAAGLPALREACRRKIPILALGGVTMDNAVSCLETGAAGIAGIRLFQENKIEDVVRALRGV